MFCYSCKGQTYSTIKKLFLRAHFHHSTLPPLPALHYLRALVSTSKIVGQQGTMKGPFKIWHTCSSQLCSDGLQLQAMTIHSYALRLLSLSVKKIKDKWTCADRAHTQATEIYKIECYQIYVYLSVQQRFLMAKCIFFWPYVFIYLCPRADSKMKPFLTETTKMFNLISQNQTMWNPLTNYYTYYSSNSPV